MIEVKYYKDFRYNYLIMKSEEAPIDMYQCKMITGNKIEGLLPCQERHVNGDMLLYYEITSKQSLSSIYENNKINIKQLLELFRQLKRVWEGISKFLLDESCLILKPEFVFADVETKELSFLYYPFEAEENYMVTFLEFLAEKVDSEDREAVEVIYKMLDLSTKQQFVLDEVLQWLEEEFSVLNPEISDTFGYEESDQQDPGFNVDENEFSVKPEISVKLSVRNRRGEKPIYFCMILSAVLEGILYYFYVTWQLSQKAQIFIYMWFLVLGTLFLACGIYLLYKKLFGMHVESKNKEEEDKLYQNPVVCEKLQEQEEQTYGNTIFIPWVENHENKLYGTGKGNKNHIDLSRLPLTVGKLAGSVDMVINDQSISRRHVKFAREGNRVCMTDLNSTNGTFKNGLRLQPNASEILEPGDEIRLGKLKFIYR